MKAQLFATLDEEEKIIALSKGVCIAERFDEFGKVLLYDLNNLYVEAFFNIQFNGFYKFQIFSETAGLDIYLQDIELLSFF